MHLKFLLLPLLHLQFFLKKGSKAVFAMVALDVTHATPTETNNAKDDHDVNKDERAGDEGRKTKFKITTCQCFRHG